MPQYLRFVRGVVDSTDLPLNVSREMLQNNPVLRKIQSGIVKRLLKDLKTRAQKTEEYEAFWNVFGAVFKEGLYEDFERRDDLLELARFRSTAGDGLVSLKDYVGRVKDGQDAVYYITGENAATLKNSPQLEGFIAKGIEVLLLTDPIDEFWIPSVGVYEKLPLKSVAEAGADLSKITGDEKQDPPEDAAPEDTIKSLIKNLKKTLGEAIADVRSSDRLTESPVCLVSETGGMSLHLARMLKQHGEGPDAIPKVLEINPRHGLIKRMAALPEDALSDAAHLLLDQARIVEGESVPDPTAFARRLSVMVEKGLA